jgi:glutathione S-transferase
MSEVTVFSVPGSPYGRAVLATLEEKALQYRLSPLEPSAIRGAAYLSRQPFGKFPAIEHEGFCLYETQAILRYLDRLSANVPLSPTNIRSLARMDQVMNINDSYLFRGVGNVIGFQRVVGPRLMGLTPDEAAIEAAMPRAHLVFGELARLLGDQTYLAGDTISLADLMVAAQIDFIFGTPEWDPLTQNIPKLVAWFRRLQERDSMKKTTWSNVSEMAKAA